MIAVAAMLALEVAAPAGAVVAGACGVVAERTHRRRRYARTLRSIESLERELGIGQPPPVVQPRDLSWQAGYATKYVGAWTDSFEVPRPPYTGPARGYQGPELTDADVRRLEHPDEFA